MSVVWGIFNICDITGVDSVPSFGDRLSRCWYSFFVLLVTAVRIEPETFRMLTATARGWPRNGCCYNCAHVTHWFFLFLSIGRHMWHSSRPGRLVACSVVKYQLYHFPNDSVLFFVWFLLYSFVFGGPHLTRVLLDLCSSSFFVLHLCMVFPVSPVFFFPHLHGMLNRQCECNVSQSPENGSTDNSQNVLRIKYTSDNVQHFVPLMNVGETNITKHKCNTKMGEIPISEIAECMGWGPLDTIE